MFSHDFRQTRRKAAASSDAHHNRGASVTATPVRQTWPLIALSFAASLTLSCQTQQKFPPATLASARATPAPQFFVVKPRRLVDQPTFTDRSSLNAEAAGAHGFVRAELGHFIDDRAARLRFF